MKSLIITYNLSNIDQYKKVLFNRRLFGYIDNSNKCAYQYRREGILNKVKFIKLGRGAFVIKQEDKSQIIKLFRKHKVKYGLIPISISENEFN